MQPRSLPAVSARNIGLSKRLQRGDGQSAAPLQAAEVSAPHTSRAILENRRHTAEDKETVLKSRQAARLRHILHALPSTIQLMVIGGAQYTGFLHS